MSLINCFSLLEENQDFTSCIKECIFKVIPLHWSTFTSFAHKQTGHIENINREESWSQFYCKDTWISEHLRRLQEDIFGLMWVWYYRTIHTKSKVKMQKLKCNLNGGSLSFNFLDNRSPRLHMASELLRNRCAASSVSTHSVMLVC